MRLEINNRTKWYEFKGKVPDAQLNMFIEQIQKEYTVCHPFDFNQLTIGQFAELLECKLPRVLHSELCNLGVTVFQVVAVRNAVDKFMKFFNNIHEQYKVPQTAAEQVASAGLLQPSIIEAMLIFTRQYFGLHDFGAAERITLLEYLLAKKHTFITESFQRRHHAELTRKSKINNKRNR